MGAPKQKWTSEEEAALKAGIHKYGTGKWSTILKDPEFSIVLRARSNVDLKDKWRNLNCMANGLGSRNRTRLMIKSKQDDDATVREGVLEKDSEVHDVTSLASSSEAPQDVSSRKPISRLDDLVLEAISKLKEPRGSNRPAIAQYIEEHYSAASDFERNLVATLKTLTENGRLIKVKNQYRIAPRSISFAALKEPQLLSPNGTKDLPETKANGIVLLTKAKIDAELEKMKSMSAAEAAAAAAKAVAEAEAAIAEAEAAAREAEEAEAEAEAARCFAEAAQKALNCQTIRVW